MRGYQFKSAVENTLRKLESTLAKQRFRIGSISWTDIQTASIRRSGNMYYISLADVKDHLNIKPVLLDKYLGFVIHELLHAMYTDFDASSQVPYVAQLFNAVEDVRIERKAIERSILGNVEQVLAKTINIMVDKAMDQVTDWTDPCQYPFAFAVYGRKYARPVPLAQGLEPIFKQASAMIDTCSDSRDALKVAEWIFDQLNQFEDQSPNQQKQDQAQGQGEGEGDGNGQGEGQGQEGAQDGSNQSTGAQSGEGEGEGASDKENAPQARKPDPQQAKEVEPKCKLPRGCSNGGSYSKDATLGEPNYHAVSKREIDLNTPITPKLRFEVRKLFEMSGVDEFEHNHKFGRLNSSALASITTGKVNVFKRHREEGGIDSAVVIALDVSTSMEGLQLINAVKTTYALLETLEQAGVSTSLITFGDETSVVKPFGQNILKAKQSIKKIDCMGGTNDYFAVRYGHELLLQRNEQRKILFVVTDGQGWIESVRSQVRSAEVLGINTIGVGIGVDVSNVYRNNVLIRNISDLGNTSFKQIKLVA